MISATEALSLPTAELSKECREAADKLEGQIEGIVREKMGRNGVDITTTVTHEAVIAEVNQRLRRAGWATNWQPKLEQHPLNKALTKHVGFSLNLFPSDAAYTEHWLKTQANGSSVSKQELLQEAVSMAQDLLPEKF